MSPTKAVPKIAPLQANEERLMTILLAPVVSEKATQIADRHNQVIFRVRPDATKKDVKRAVELLWKEKKIEVASVQIVNVHGKKKRFGAFTGRRRARAGCWPDPRARVPCPSVAMASCATCSLRRATSAPCYRCAHSPGTQ